jgi:hypothetical protein
MTYIQINKTDQVITSNRFYRVVSLHILKNMLRKTKVQVPLLLGIHGPSGEGKTYQCEAVLRKMGVRRFVISGGQLESAIEGEPAYLLRSVYLRASEAMRSGECSMAVILFNDVDTGLGDWVEKSKYSMNQITLYGELMHLVDYPSMVEGKDTLRVPIILTGNDFSKLYKPLIRAGRMTSFEWIPTIDERVEIVNATFPELSPEECRRLIQELSERAIEVRPDRNGELPVAFYTHLRSTLMDEDLWQLVEGTGLQRTIDQLVKGDEPDLSSRITYERVLKKGLQLAGTSIFINHHISTPPFGSFGT